MNNNLEINLYTFILNINSYFEKFMFKIRFYRLGRFHFRNLCYALFLYTYYILTTFLFYSTTYLLDLYILY